MAEIALGTGGPPGHAMRLRVYLSQGPHAPKSLPCVLVPPAGTNMLIGMKMDDLSYADETVPYVKAGFAVVHYSLDGAVGNMETMSIAELMTLSP